MFLYYFVILLSCQKFIDTRDLFELSVIHVNDIHARFEEISTSSTRCIDDCIGGFSRLHSAVHSLVKQRPNAIFLNAGDNFQGSLWYNLHGWNVTQHFLNKLPTDAMTLGNHEFDDGIGNVVEFIKAMKCPTVVANIDASDEPRMQGIFNKSTVIIRSNWKIGIIGAIVSNTNLISRSEKLKFTNEVNAVNEEAKRLVTEEKCKIIIVLSHCGLEVDKRIAREVGPNVGLVVGGHTHTFLYTGERSPGPETPKGPYPIVVSNRNDGRKVLVVQASYNTIYLGNISIWFDSEGSVVRWAGNPIYLDESVPQDEEINKEIAEWKESVDIYGNTVLGTSNVLLDRSSRRKGESNIGSFYADAMVDYYVKLAEKGSWTYAAIAVINSGVIRTSILPGSITYYDLIASQPFHNTIDCVELSGRNIKDMLEYSVTTSSYRPNQLHEFLQVSGIRVLFNISKPVNSRVIRVQLRCQKCLVPKYYEVNYTETYRVIVPSFLAFGGDGYSIIQDNMRNRIMGESDVQVFTSYIEKMSPITQGHDDRIILHGTLNTFNESVSNHSSAFINNFMSVVIAYTISFLFYMQTSLFL